LTFKLQSKTSKPVYCGVAEFSTNEYQMFTPQWIFDLLNINKGDRVHITNIILNKGKYAKFKPLNDSFLKLSNPKIILENYLRKRITLYKDQIIIINYLKKQYQIQVIEVSPNNAICINNTDLNIEFECINNNDEDSTDSDSSEDQSVLKPNKGIGRKCSSYNIMEKSCINDKDYWSQLGRL
jgi:hypothetical protein